MRRIQSDSTLHLQNCRAEVVLRRGHVGDRYVCLIVIGTVRQQPVHMILGLFQITASDQRFARSRRAWKCCGCNSSVRPSSW